MFILTDHLAIVLRQHLQLDGTHVIFLLKHRNMIGLLLKDDLLVVMLRLKRIESGRHYFAMLFARSSRTCLTRAAWLACQRLDLNMAPTLWSKILLLDWNLPLCVIIKRGIGSDIIFWVLHYFFVCTQWCWLVASLQRWFLLSHW